MKRGPKSEIFWNSLSRGETRFWAAGCGGQSFGARDGGWIKCINILRREGGGRGKGREGDRYTDIQKNPGGGERVMAHMMASL